MMGVVMSDRPPIGRQRFFTVILLLLILGMGAFAIYSFATHRPPITDWSVTQLARAVQNGQVDRLSLYDDRAVVDAKNSIRALVFSPAGAPIIASLRSLGVSEESLSGIEIVRQAPPRFGPIDFLQWFWSVPIIILVGAGGFALRLVHKSRHHQTI